MADGTRRWPLAQDLAQDVRVGIRNLLRTPVLAGTVLLTVGIGIGATTAIFAAVNAALLQPLPYPEPDRLVRIYTDAPPYWFNFSVADYLALRDQQTQFESIAGYTYRTAAFSDGSVAERLRGREVTWTYFGLLGLQPAIGRDFVEADGVPGNPPAVIVSHGFWQRRLGGSAAAIDRPVRLDGVDHRLAGVLPEAVGPLETRQDFFVAAQWRPPQRKGPFFVIALGRLKRGAAPATASSELRAINARMFPVWKASYQDDRATWGLVDLKRHVVGRIDTVALLALSAVALVWLIAAANASGLLVARVTARQRELAVRAALGASRGRVVRYLLAESAVLACGAAAIGWAVAWGGAALIRSAGATYFPRMHEVAIDGPVLTMLIGLTVASALLFGLVPALSGTTGRLDEALRSSSRTATGTRDVRRVRRLLVGAQFAVATPLLVVAGLLIVTLDGLKRVDVGFDTRNIVTGGIHLPAAQYREPAQMTTFWDELKRRLEALPGVTGVAFADGRPPADVGNFNNFDLEQYPTPPGGSQPVTPWVAVSPEYFHVLGLTLLEGRLFDDRDGRGQTIETIVVDRAWAKRFFPNESAVGKRLKEGGCTSCPWTVVVGVVSDVKYAGLDKPDQGSVYWPIVPALRSRNVVVRSAADASVVMPAVQQAVRSLDPTLPFASPATIDQLIERSLQQPRALSLLVAALAIVALVLSSVGVYGVMAHYVEQHAQDIGIRLALGGTPRDVGRLVVGQGMRVVVLGLVVGIAIAFAATRFTATLLYGVSPLDARTFAAASAFLLAVAVVACLLPARRATRVEPASVLRGE